MAGAISTVGKVLTSAPSIVGTIAGIGGKIFNGIKNIFSGNSSKVRDVGTQVGETINYGKQQAGAIGDSFKNAYNNFSSGNYSGAFNSAMQGMQGIGNTMQGMYGRGQDIYNNMSGIYNDVRGGINSMMQQVRPAVEPFRRRRAPVGEGGMSGGMMPMYR